MVDHDCQLDWTYSQLEDILLGVPVRVFPERVN